MFREILCYFKKLYRTFRYAMKTGDMETEVGGHLFEQVQHIPNCVVTVTKCKRCGKEDFSWHRMG